MAELALGTAGLARKYGVTNSGGAPDENEAVRIIELALESNIGAFDTAPAYESEAILGQALGEREAKIVTKTFPSASGLNAPAGLERSLAKLGRTSIYALLLHHADGLTREAAESVGQELNSVLESGAATKVGFSTYDPDSLERLLEVMSPGIVQIPLSVLDQRFATSGTIAALAAADIEVHTRSAFLQGAIFLNPSALPDPIRPARSQIERLQEAANAAGVPPSAVALAFCLRMPGVSNVVVGANSREELNAILASAQFQGEIDPGAYECDDLKAIDPRSW